MIAAPILNREIQPPLGLWASLRRFSAPKQGALIAALLVATLLQLNEGYDMKFGPGGLYSILAVAVVIPILCVMAGLLGAGLFGGVVALVRLALRRRPLWSPRAAREGLYSGLMLLGFGGTTASWMGAGFEPAIRILPHALGLAFLPVLLGAAIGVVAERGWRPLSAGLLALAVALNSGLGFFLFYRPGFDPGAPGWSTAPGVKAVQAENPGLPGAFRVFRLTYGSGTDKRAEFGKHAVLKTDTVDIRALRPDYPGWKGAARQWAWGFDYGHVPLNGRVWYPEGAGPFPLILFVHGNHEGFDYSDPGYAYLGELLASRGFIFVSVDQNFLNGSFLGSATDEMGARGYLLLKHIGVWAGWNGEQGNPFYGKVDLKNVAVGGHSRGGEASAVAAMLNKLPTYPGTSLPLDFHYNIKAVLSYAPSDGQFKLNGQGTRVEDVNYLVIQGGRDMDAWEFMGLRQYDRTKFTGEGFYFKGGLWIDNLNHGQMNTTWNTDHTPPGSWLRNESPLMPAETSRQVLKTFVSAFFETTLHGDRGYLPFLQDYRTGAAWLPAAKLAMLYEDSTFLPVATFDEDLNPESTRILGGKVIAEGVTVQEPKPWLREQGLIRESRTAEVTWTAPDGRYTLQLPEDLPNNWRPLAGGNLVFALADGTPSTTPHDPVDLTVELQDRAGKVARVALSRYGAPLPKPVIPISRFGLMEHVTKKENYGPVVETFTIPVAEFVGVDLSRLAAIRFVFDKAPAGTVYLDDIGFRFNP